MQVNMDPARMAEEVAAVTRLHSAGVNLGQDRGTHGIATEDACCAWCASQCQARRCIGASWQVTHSSPTMWCRPGVSRSSTTGRWEFTRWCRSWRSGSNVLGVRWGDVKRAAGAQ